jgi:hypothetical protein
MAKNRSLEQKKLKMKKRGRFARFSGATTKFASSYVDVVEHVDDDTTTVKTIEVFVGKPSLSKAVISTGRGPDAERMQEYYQRVHSFDQALPQTLGLTGPMKELKERFDKIVNETPKINKLCLFDHPEIGQVYIFYTSTQYFFVETQLKEKKIRRSRIYGSMKYARKMYAANQVTWVEVISSRHSSASHPAQSSRD